MKKNKDKRNKNKNKSKVVFNVSGVDHWLEDNPSFRLEAENAFFKAIQINKLDGVEGLFTLDVSAQAELFAQPCISIRISCDQLNDKSLFNRCRCPAEDLIRKWTHSQEERQQIISFLLVWMTREIEDLINHICSHIEDILSNHLMILFGKKVREVLVNNFGFSPFVHFALIPDDGVGAVFGSQVLVQWRREDYLSALTKITSPAIERCKKTEDGSKEFSEFLMEPISDSELEKAVVSFLGLADEQIQRAKDQSWATVIGPDLERYEIREVCSSAFDGYPFLSVTDQINARRPKGKDMKKYRGAGLLISRRDHRDQMEILIPGTRFFCFLSDEKLIVDSSVIEKEYITRDYRQTGRRYPDFNQSEIHTHNRSRKKRDEYLSGHPLASCLLDLIRGVSIIDIEDLRWIMETLLNDADLPFSSWSVLGDEKEKVRSGEFDQMLQNLKELGLLGFIPAQKAGKDRACIFPAE